VIQGERLVVSGMRKSFGGLTAVNDVSLTAEAGEITSLIGPNGAGKTTFFHCVTGIVAPDVGEVRLGGVDLSGMTPDRRAREGMARTFQRLELFGGLTVFENLQVAIEAKVTRRLWHEVLSLRHADDPAHTLRIENTLELLGISHLADQAAGSLPTGLARVVELGRALCTDPKVLLLDEPASGLDAGETSRLRDVLVMLAGQGLTILLVEHDVELVMALSSRLYVMEFGSVIASGTPAEIAVNTAVRAAYLGVEEA
jgi:ABC-type branched-subunit amino acid transport system ATPase component